MNPEIKKYLIDILLSIEAIEEYHSQFSHFYQFSSNQMALDATERRLAIIGEALNKANQLNSELEISHKKKIIGLRHILVHDYDLVDPPIIWKIVVENIPLLKEEIDKLIKQNE